MKTKITALNVQNTETEVNESGKFLFNLTREEIAYIFNSYFDVERKCTVAVFEALETIQKKNRNKDSCDYEIYASEVLSIIGLLDAAEDDINLCDSLNKEELTCEQIRKINEHLTKIIDKIDKKGIHNFINEAMSLPCLVKTKSAIEDALSAFGCILSLYVIYETRQPAKESSGVSVLRYNGVGQ